MSLWAILWRSENKREGVKEHIVYRDMKPLLFARKHDAREWIEQMYGYIKNRRDLREESHGWKMPVPVKVSVVLADGGKP